MTQCEVTNETDNEHADEIFIEAEDIERENKTTIEEETLKEETITELNSESNNKAFCQTTLLLGSQLQYILKDVQVNQSYTFKVSLILNLCHILSERSNK